MSANPTTSKCVVIADDSASVRDRFRSAVESAGHRAITVRSAAELFARVRADLDRLDLLLVDLRRTDPRLLRRYMGAHGAAAFLERHATPLAA